MYNMKDYLSQSLNMNKAILCFHLYKWCSKCQIYAEDLNLELELICA